VAVDAVRMLQAILQALLVLRGKVMPEVLVKAAPQMVMYSAEAAVVALAREALAALVLARPEETVLPLQSQVHQSHVLAAVVAVSGLLVPLRVQVAQEEEAMAVRMLMVLRVPPIQAAAEVALVQAPQISFAQAALVALVW